MALFIFLNTNVGIFASCFRGLFCFVISRCFIGKPVIRAAAARTADISHLLTTLLHLYVRAPFQCLVDGSAMRMCARTSRAVTITCKPRFVPLQCEAFRRFHCTSSCFSRSLPTSYRDRAFVLCSACNALINNKKRSY